MQVRYVIVTDWGHYLTNEGDYTNTLSEALFMRTIEEALDNRVFPYERIITIVTGGVIQ